MNFDNRYLQSLNDSDNGCIVGTLYLVYVPWLPLLPLLLMLLSAVHVRLELIIIGRHGSASLCRVERENKMAATCNVLAFKRYFAW